jgi:hypothetical protein
MKQCYSYEVDSDMEERIDGVLVRCTEPCGPYIITHKALNDLIEIHGRKQGAIKRVKALRQRDRERLIRISHDSVSFVP